MSKIALKPCPCCGSDKVVYYHYDPERLTRMIKYVVLCQNCGVQVRKDSPAEAIDIWNRRVEV